jgi:tryptophan-rich sensory protein
MPVRRRLVDIVVLVLLMVLCLGIGALAAMVAAASFDAWYEGLTRPVFHLPDEAFAPAWAVLYVLMAVAAWRVWRTGDRDTVRGPLTLFVLQLAINLGWVVVLFGLQKIGSAVATIVVLDVAILVTMLAFRTVDRAAALLMAPYLVWMAYITVLNVAVWRLNPTV